MCREMISRAPTEIALCIRVALSTLLTLFKISMNARLVYGLRTLPITQEHLVSLKTLASTKTEPLIAVQLVIQEVWAGTILLVLVCYSPWNCSCSSCKFIFWWFRCGWMCNWIMVTEELKQHGSALLFPRWLCQSRWNLRLLCSWLYPRTIRLYWYVSMLFFCLLGCRCWWMCDWIVVTTSFSEHRSTLYLSRFLYQYQWFIQLLS